MDWMAEKFNFKFTQKWLYLTNFRDRVRPRTDFRMKKIEYFSEAVFNKLLKPLQLAFMYWGRHKFKIGFDWRQRWRRIPGTHRPQSCSIKKFLYRYNECPQSLASLHTWGPRTKRVSGHYSTHFSDIVRACRRKHWRQPLNFSTEAK